jgi:hypothetical protein
LCDAVSVANDRCCDANDRCCDAVSVANDRSRHAQFVRIYDFRKMNNCVRERAEFIAAKKKTPDAQQGRRCAKTRQAALAGVAGRRNTIAATMRHSFD